MHLYVIERTKVTNLSLAKNKNAHSNINSLCMRHLNIPPINNKRFEKYCDSLTSYSIPHEIRQGAKCHDEQVAYKFIFFVNQGYRRMALHAMEKLYE